MRLRGQRPGVIFQLLWSSLASERAPPPGSHVPAMYGYSRPTEMPDSDWASNSKPFRARRQLLGSLPLKIAGLPSVCLNVKSSEPPWLFSESTFPSVLLDQHDVSCDDGRDKMRLAGASLVHFAHPRVHPIVVLAAIAAVGIVQIRTILIKCGGV